MPHFISASGSTSVVLCAWAVEQAVHGAGSQAVPAL